jgi:hypothetical protein
VTIPKVRRARSARTGPIEIAGVASEKRNSPADMQRERDDFTALQCRETAAAEHRVVADRAARVQDRAVFAFWNLYQRQCRWRWRGRAARRQNPDRWTAAIIVSDHTKPNTSRA